MTLDDIYTEWDKDSKIDQTELAKEALKIPQLHNKYYKFAQPWLKKRPPNQSCHRSHLEKLKRLDHFFRNYFHCPHKYHHYNEIRLALRIPLARGERACHLLSDQAPTTYQHKLVFVVQ